MNKKGQSALEFIMTYGWALVVLLLVISSLWFTFGGDKFFVNEKCMMGPGFLCKDFSVDEGSIQLKVLNSQGKDLDSISFTYTDCTVSSDNPPLRNGEERLFTVTGCPFTELDVFDDRLDFAYKFVDSSIMHSKATSVIALIANGNSQAFGGSGNGYGSDGNTLLLYKFDEGDGKIVSDESSNENDGTHFGNTKLLLHFDGDVKDSSGNGLDGTPNLVDNTVALYHFDGDVKDSSGRNNGGIIVGDPVFVNGINGQALSFDGVNDYVNTSIAVETSKPFSIEFWVNVSGNGVETHPGIFSTASTGTGAGINFWTLSTESFPKNFRFKYGNLTGSSNTHLIPTSFGKDKWHHFALTYTGNNTLKAYTDGNKIYENKNMGPIIFDATTLRLGRGNGHFEGELDEVGIYSRVLLEEEILEHYGARNVLGENNYVDTANGNGIIFDGEKEYVNLGNPAELQIIDDQTIVMFMKSTNKGDYRRNPYAKAYGGEGTITMEPSGQMSYYFGISGKNKDPYERHSTYQYYNSDEFLQSVVVRDLKNGKVRWYKNGDMVKESNTTYLRAKASTLNTFIGTGYLNKFSGVMDEFAIYSAVVSDDQIKRMNDAGRVMFGDWTDGKYGTALNFDGVDDHMKGINQGVYMQGLEETTVEAWIYPRNVTGRQYIVTKNGPVMIALNDNHFSGGVHTENYAFENLLVGEIDINPNEWTHVAMTYNGTEVKLYVNGVQEQNLGNNKYKDGKFVADGCLNIGRYTSGNCDVGPNYYFDGLIDEVRISDYARYE